MMPILPKREVGRHTPQHCSVLSRDDTRMEHVLSDLILLPGALNVPMAQLGKQLSKLPRRTQIVAYCRGPYCVLSFEAVAALRAKGYDARRLEDGFPEWKAAGLPVRSASSG